MFEKDLAEILKRMFKLKKATFSAPSEEREQEVIFIQIEKALVRIMGERQVARVMGKITIFSQAGKMPYGYLSKQIQEAKPADSKPLFFWDLEENNTLYQNIDERTASFQFLFSSQHNPNKGELTKLTFDQVER